MEKFPDLPPNEWFVMVDDKVVSHGKNFEEVLTKARESYPDAEFFVAKIPDPNVVSDPLNILRKEHRAVVNSIEEQTELRYGCPAPAPQSEPNTATLFCFPL